MPTIRDLKYSMQLGELGDHIFIDGVCVKSRTLGKKITIEEAMETNQSVIVQENDKVKIYPKRNVERFERVISFLEDEVNNNKHSHYTYLLRAINNGDVTIMKDEVLL